MKTLHDFASGGWLVRVDHVRRYRHYSGDVVAETKTSARLRGLVNPLPKGGVTVVHILSPGEDTYGRGEHVFSDDTNYCRKQGVERALQQAVASLGVEHPQHFFANQPAGRIMSEASFGNMPSGTGL